HARRDPGAGDQLHRLPRSRAQWRAGLVPRAGRRRAVHRQAPPLPTAAPHREGHPMTATDRAIELTRAAALAAADKQAADIIAFDVSDQLAITDVFLLASASNQPQMNAVKDAIEE